MKLPAWWRRAVTIALISLGCLMATISVAVIWLHKVVLDTDTYVETVAPLSEDTAIKQAVAAAATEELFARSDADQRAREALPDRLDFLAAPIIGATEGFVDEQILKLLDSQEFSHIWQEANRRGHQGVVRVLRGEPGSVQAEQGRVVLDLTGLIEAIKDRLAGRGIDIFENISFEEGALQLTLFESSAITQAQSAIELLDRLSYWLPVLSLVLLGAALWLSRGRAVTVMLIGLGVSAGMVVLLVAFTLARGYYLDAVSSAGSVDLPAATSFFDIVAGSLKTAVRRVFAAALLLAAAGFILSPYPLALKLRSALRQAMKKAGETGGTLKMGPAGAWITEQKPALRVGGVVAVLVVLAAMDQPSLSGALVLVVALIIYLAALELISSGAGNEP